MMTNSSLELVLSVIPTALTIATLLLLGLLGVLLGLRRSRSYLLLTLAAVVMGMGEVVGIAVPLVVNLYNGYTETTVLVTMLINSAITSLTWVLMYAAVLLPRLGIEPADEDDLVERW